MTRWQIVLLRVAVGDHVRAVAEADQLLSAFEGAEEAGRAQFEPSLFVTLASARARSLASLGDPARALAELEPVLSETTKILGRANPNLVDARMTVASLLARMGEVKAAISKYHELLVDTTTTLGADAPLTFLIRGNLAALASRETNRSRSDSSAGQTVPFLPAGRRLWGGSHRADR